MRWPRALIIIASLPWISLASPSFSSERKRELRELVKQTWYHGFDNYMRVAFPMDELRPISCQGMGSDKENPHNWAVNDVNGNFALTLVDVLDTLVVLGDKRGFDTAVRNVILHVQFDLDSRIQVFEATIRVLGGLLSGHLFATDPKYGFQLAWYRGELLHMARDLANRMLPAFSATATGIPYARINLRHGVVSGERTETCAAAAGSLLLEFATLSRLTGEPVYEDVARKAFYAVWNRRSNLDLVGNSIDVQTGNFIYPVASVGAGIDSLYEYMLKSYVLFGEDEYFRVWDNSYKALQKHLRSADGLWYRSVNMVSGVTVNQFVDSLSAFLPGLQVLAGDVESAIHSHQLFANEWIRYRGIPEVYVVPQRQASSLAYPLRPELVESTLFLYQATNDDAYLKFGERMVHDIINRTRIDCGLASVENLETGKLEDRMHSFALSETLKYAYLIFDEDSIHNRESTHAVFTTEGHLLPLPKEHLKAGPIRRQQHSVEALTCSRYIPDKSKHWSPLALSVTKRTDSEYARMIAGVNFNTTSAISKGYYDVNGFCDRPSYEEHVSVGDYLITTQQQQLVDILFTDNASSEDSDPSASKVAVTSEQIIIRSIENLRLQLIRRSDPSQSAAQTWYDIAKVAAHQVSAKQSVIIADPNMRSVMLKDASTMSLDLRFEHGGGILEGEGHLSSFGPSALSPTSDLAPGRPPITIIAAPQIYGCEAFSLSTQSHAKVVALVHRGECTFAQKSTVAAQAGAKGLLVVNSDDNTFTPSNDQNDGQHPYVPLIMLSNSTGTALEELLAKSGVTMIAKEKPKMTPKAIENMALILNGFLVRNARLSPS